DMHRPRPRIRLGNISTPLKPGDKTMDAALARKPEGCLDLLVARGVAVQCGVLLDEAVAVELARRHAEAGGHAVPLRTTVPSTRRLYLDDGARLPEARLARLRGLGSRKVGRGSPRNWASSRRRRR